MDEKQLLGARIRMWRRYKGLNQTDLGERMHTEGGYGTGPVGQQYMGKWERGLHRYSWDALKAIAIVLRESVEIITKVDPPQPEGDSSHAEAKEEAK